MPVKFPWKQHDFGKMSIFFSFNLHTEESEHQKVKAKFKKRNHFYQSKQFCHGLLFGGKYPRRCISGVMHSTFAMLTCNDVQKIEDTFVFFWVNKISLLPIAWMGGHDFNLYYLYYQQNTKEKWQKSAPLHFKFVKKCLTDFASHSKLYQVSAWS